MTKKDKKHKHLKTKVKILHSIMDKGESGLDTITIQVDDLSKAFGFRDLEDMTKYAWPEAYAGRKEQPIRRYRELP